MWALSTRKNTKKPLTCENTVPEVGLELHSSPCEHWVPSETYGIRPDPIDVRPDPKPKLWTLSTLLSDRF